MTTVNYLWTPRPAQTMPVHGTEQHFPINRLFFVGRNYHAHATEMGKPVDKSTERPFYFTKSPQTLTLSALLSHIHRKPVTTILKWNWWSPLAKRGFVLLPTRHMKLSMAMLVAWT